MTPPPPPRILESSLNSEQVAGLQEVAQDAADFLEIQVAESTGRTTIACIEHWLCRLQQHQVRVPKGEEVDLFMGSLWGACLVKDLGWQWAEVTFLDADGAKAIGVFAPDRSLAIYPFHYLYGCLEHSLPLRLLDAFDWLQQPTEPLRLPPNRYENVMSRFE